jgi:transposase
MKYVNSLNDTESATLRSAHKNHPSARVRTRSQIILLSNQGYYVKEIAAICQMTRQAVSDVIDRWEQSGLIGLYDKPRPGQPRKLTPEDEEFILYIINQDPRSLNPAMAALEDQRGKKVSRATVIRVLKKTPCLEKDPQIP